jgi:dTDP-4-dehydrorhamnose reductase
MISSLEGKRLVILGATGLLGQPLLRYAQRLSMQAIGVARTNADINIDITETNELNRVLNDAKPDLIINAAALVNLELCEADPKNAYLINAAVVATLANFCRSRQTKLIQVSTDHYYESDHDKLHSENASVSLLNHYAKTKYAAEAFAQTLSNALTIRTNIIGFRGWLNRPTFVEWVIQSLINRERITLFADFYTSSIDADHCAHYIYQLIQNDAVGLINLGSRECVSKAKFIMALAKKLGLSIDNCELGFLPRNSIVSRADSLGLSVERIENILGCKMPTMTEVVDSIAEEYKG